MRKNKGFTAIELLAVVAVLSVLAVIVVPRASSLLTDQRLQTTLRQLLADAQSVRQQAIMRGETMRMDFIRVSGGPHQVRVYVESTELTEQRRILPADITFQDSGMNFSFNYLGEPVAFGAPTGNKTVTVVAANGKKLYLVLSSAGRVRISTTHP